MKTLVSLTVALFFCFISQAQNVGIGTNNPSAQLHVFGPGTVPLRVESASSTTSEIIFFTNGTSKGLIGAYSGEFEVMTNKNIPLHLGTNLSNRLTITGTGNVGIATETPDERLVVNGNIKMAGNLEINSSTLGVILNASDRPLITRGWDMFTSGNYNNIGRWGMFMEFKRLSLGIPNTVGSAFAFSAYEANSTRNEVLTINRVGGVVRPGTNNVDLLPVCMGSVKWNNGSQTNTTVINGTGNFTLTPYADGGFVEITIDGHYYTTGNYITQVTCIRDDGYGTSTGRAVVKDSGNGKLQVYTYINGNTQYSRSFHFVVYKVN